MSDIKPYHTEEDKKTQIEAMFDNISHRYDLLNRFLTMGIDQYWRQKLLSEVKDPENVALLDVATGTADIAIMAARKYGVHKITGMDLSSQMLEKGRTKVKNAHLEGKIDLIQGDSEKMTFQDGTFDVITCGFGVRNFGNLQAGLNEMYRVLKPGGQCLILEFSRPHKFPVAQLYHFYFKNVLPLIGKISSSDGEAYRYLYESAMAFPEYEEFTGILSDIGFKNTQFNSLTVGICCIYTAIK